MACPVNAVEITASAMMAGTNAAARSVPKEPSGSSVNPTRSVIGMNMVSSNCSPLRSRSRSSRPNCAASIFCTVAGRGSGENVPGAKRFVIVVGSSRKRSSRSQLPASQIEEDVLKTALLDSHVGRQYVQSSAPRGDSSQHLRVDVAFDEVFTRRGLGRLVTLGQRRHQQ